MIGSLSVLGRPFLGVTRHDVNRGLQSTDINLRNLFRLPIQLPYL